MFRRTVSLIALVTLIALLLPAQALAAGAGGSGPHDTLAPDGTWTGIEAGQRHWYSFFYEGDESQITVSMDAEPKDGAVFKIYTPRQVADWGLADVEEDKPCGCGTENEYAKADHFWSGNFNTTGNYYVVVEHSGVRPATAYYSLLAAGEGVYVRPATVRITHRAPAVAETRAPAVERGATPATAIGLNQDFEQLEMGHEHWIKFDYTGDESQITVALFVEPSHGASFSVWTPELMRQYQAGQDVDPIGRGSENEYASGDLFWSGNFTSPGTYYIRVEHGGAMPSWCKMTISGDGVRL